MKVTLEQRFWSKVDKTESCWNWTGATNPRGYGKITIRGRTVSAHRLSFIFAGGIVGSGKGVLHTCDNTSCVNPDHLYAGTQKDNNHDAYNRRRRLPPSGNPKISRYASESIRKEYMNKQTTMERLAVRFGIGYSQIWRIIHRQSWK